MDKEHLNIAQDILISGARAKKLYAKLGEAMMKEKSLSMNEADLLMYFTDNENSESGAAKQRAISKSLVSKAVDSLVKKDLVSIELDEADRRCKKVVIQEKGREMAKDIQILRAHFASIVMKDITDEQLGIIKQLIETISKNIQEGLRQMDQTEGKRESVYEHKDGIF